MTPIFSICDYPTAREFYMDWLGFGIDWKEELVNGLIYMQISRDDVVLHLASAEAHYVPGARARAEMRGLRAYHRQLQSRVSTHPCPCIAWALWDDRVLEMEIMDPFGNLIIFCEPSS